MVPEAPVAGTGTGAASEAHPGPHHAGRTAQQGLQAGYSYNLQYKIYAYSLFFRI